MTDNGRTHAVSEWLAEMTAGNAPADQNWLALQKHFKSQLNEPRKMTAVMEDKIAAKFLQQVIQGEHATSKTSELFDQVAQEMLDRQRIEIEEEAGEVRKGPVPVHNNDEVVRRLMAELEAAQKGGGDPVELASIRERLRHTNEWRFRLESACRYAHGELAACLHVHQRAPSQGELSRVVARLEEGLL